MLPDRGVVVSEMLTSSAGIGYLVTLNRTILDSPRVFAAILTILVLAIAYYMMARAIESRGRPAEAVVLARRHGRCTRAVCRLKARLEIA